MMKDKTREQLVEASYNRIARIYHNERHRFDTRDVLQRFMTLLPPDGALLDLGCGSGVPVARTLVDAGFRVTGVDRSSAMLAIARDQVPEALFLEADMRALDFPDAVFDGICAFYSIFHLPREHHESLFRSLYRILKPGGLFLFSSGDSEWEGVEEFHGTDMFWSHYDPETTGTLIEQAGFSSRFAETIEHGGEEHVWILAEKEGAIPG